MGPRPTTSKERYALSLDVKLWFCFSLECDNFFLRTTIRVERLLLAAYGRSSGRPLVPRVKGARGEANLEGLKGEENLAKQGD